MALFWVEGVIIWFITRRQAQAEEYIWVSRVKCAVVAGRFLKVLPMTGAAGSPWQSDFKLALRSALLALRGDGGIAVHSAASSQTSRQCVTDNRGRWSQSWCSNKINQSKVNWLHSKTQVLPADMTMTYNYLFGVKILFVRAWKHVFVRAWHEVRKLRSDQRGRWSFTSADCSLCLISHLKYNSNLL